MDLGQRSLRILKDKQSLDGLVDLHYELTHSDVRLKSWIVCLNYFTE